MSPENEQRRQAALSILKPSARDLEYGLRLHEESLVVESYSLGLRAPLVAWELNQATDEGVSESEYQDMVEGMRMTGWTRNSDLLKEYLELWESAGVNCMFLNAGEEGNQPTQLIKRMARYIALCDALPRHLIKVTSVESILNAKDAGKMALCLTTNGVPLSGSTLNVRDELAYLRVFAQLGVKMMHLTYNRRNALADGCMEPANGGLSDFGRQAVAEMNRLGILVDLAHTGWQSCIEAAQTSSHPVIVSHTGVYELGQHMRCKNSEVMRAVVDSGGTIGITTIPRFLGGAGDISALLDHVDWVVQNFGVDAVTIGTDTGHPSRFSAPAPAPRPKRQARWENHWMPGQAVHSAEWKRPEQTDSLAWTNWPLFTVGLVQRGYSDEEIAKVIGGNLLRVAGHVWLPTGTIPA